MWFVFGILTFIVALVSSVRRRMESNWGGEMRTLVANSPNAGLPYRFREMTRPHHKIWVGVAVPPNFRFSARLERPLDRALKWLRISYEMQLDDAAFDRLVYLEADAKGVAHWLSDSQETRTTLLSILQNAGVLYGGAAVVRCANGQLWLESSCYGNEKARLITMVVPKLHKLSASMQAQRLRPDQLNDPFVWRAAVMLSISTASLILGVFGLIRSIGRTDILEGGLLLQASIIFGLSMFVLFIIATARTVGRSSRLGLVLLETLLIGAPGFVLSTYALVREANMGLDPTPARRYELKLAIADRLTYGIGRRKYVRYVLYVHGWPRELAHKRRLEITADEYRALIRTYRAVMLVRPGALGYAWIERVIPAPLTERGMITSPAASRPRASESIPTRLGE